MRLYWNQELNCAKERGFTGGGFVCWTGGINKLQKYYVTALNIVLLRIFKSYA